MNPSEFAQSRGQALMKEPEIMGAHAVPGGKFAVFRVEKPPDRPLPPNEPGPFGTCSVPDNSRLCKNYRVTWYYALHQWLPDSDWFFDRDRISNEYSLNAVFPAGSRHKGAHRLDCLWVLSL